MALVCFALFFFFVTTPVLLPPGACAVHLKAPGRRVNPSDDVCGGFLETKHFHTAEVSELALEEMKFYVVNCSLSRGVYYAEALTGAVIWVLVIEPIFMIIWCEKKQTPILLERRAVTVSASTILHYLGWR